MSYRCGHCEREGDEDTGLMVKSGGDVVFCQSFGECVWRVHAQKDAYRKAAEWFSENVPGTPVPEWVDATMNRDWDEHGRPRGERP